MKIWTVALSVSLALLMTASLAGCRRVPIPAAGDTVTRNYELKDFDKIEAGYAFDIEITRSDNFSIAITTGENVFQRLSVTVSDGTLKISLKNTILNLRASPRAVITMPVLRGLDISGASRATASGFRSGETFRGTVSGASSLDIDMETGDFRAELSGASGLSGHLAAAATDLDLSGASNVDLGGSGGNINIGASGASQANLGDFTVGDADIDFSGASRATMEISGRLNASLSGASSLHYRGNPTLGSLDITGGSSLERD
jgi:hypothetical protein